MRKLLILLTGSVLLLCSGCASVNATALAGGPWPAYEEPAPLALSDDDKAKLQQFAKDDPDLFARIQGQAHSYRAIVREHNAKAIEHNRQLMKDLNFSQAIIDAAYPLPADAATLKQYTKPKANDGT